MNRAEESNLFQAELRKFRGSTIERKQMSTKTTFKRISLVTVAALGFGLMSAVPSQAAGMLADSLLNAADGTTTVASTATLGGTAPTAKLVWSGIATGGADTATVSGVILSVPPTSGAFAVSVAATPSITVNVNAVDTVTAGVIVANGAAGRVTKYVTASFTPDVSGTYVIALKAAGGVNNSTVTWTITVAATPAATAAASTVAMYSKAVNGGGGTPGTTPAIKADYEFLRYTSGQTLAQALTTLTGAAPASGIFSEPVTPASAGDVIGSGLVHFSNETVLAANSAVAVPMTVSISGRGYVGIGASSTTTYGTTVTESTAVGFTPFGDPGNYGRIKFFWVKSDGTTGPATITISAGGVVLGKVEMVMTGTKDKLTLATDAATKLSKNYIGSGDTATVTIVAKDAAGNNVASSGITAVTGSENGTATGTIASATINGDVVTVTGGLVSGKVTWTVTDADKRTVTFVTNTTKKTGKFVLSFDKSSYEPGEKVTWSVSGKDSDGSPIADGPRAAFGSVEANLAVATLGVGSLPATTLTFVDGAATGYFFAPSTASGTFNLSTTIGAADSTFATATTAAKAATTVSTFTITNAATDAALDAANEAATAAQDATDAAIQAADAADEATAAVAALSLEVNTLIAGLKAQLSTLYKIVIKLKNSIAAMK
jgi:trimeric autotransporter adhesin